MTSLPDEHRDVLIVEDERKLKEMLLRAIQDMEFAPTGVDCAEDALKHLEENNCSILLADLNLPGKHGLELCTEVRDRWPETQIIILTGYGDLDAAQAAIRMDVVDFLSKPCALGDLESALDRALRRRRHHIIPHAVPENEESPLDLEELAELAGSSRLEDIEREHILDVLARHDGNREATARELGISVRTLYYRLKQYTLRGFLPPSS